MTTLDITPEGVHRLGLDGVAETERQMAELRAKIGFTGTRAQFHELLRRDPRFYVKTPEEVGAVLMSHIRRIEPRVSEYFSRSPEAIYGVKRLSPALDSETVRYSIRSPAQALAYRMGRQTFVRLREKASSQLGSRFDIRRFHDAVLSVGSMPLFVLERHIDWWIRQELAR